MSISYGHVTVKAGRGTLAVLSGLSFVIPRLEGYPETRCLDEARVNRLSLHSRHKGSANVGSPTSVGTEKNYKLHHWTFSSPFSQYVHQEVNPTSDVIANEGI